MERKHRLARRLTRVLLSLAVAVLWLVAGPSVAGANQLTEITIPAKNGEIPAGWVNYDGPPRAKVLLPDGYKREKQYPLLILLAGANSSYKTWSDEKLGRIKTTAAGFPGIIVMPEGSTGYYDDWWSGGERGNPAWESYYLDQVIPQLLERYNIRPERRWHALAGVSMGGLGTAYLSGRLPGFFGSIAIFSGVVDTHLFPGFGAAATLIGQSAVGMPLDQEAMWGPEDGFYAYGHDPVRLARNQQHTRVWMGAGNGVPTSDGEPLTNNPATDIPAEVALSRPASDNYAKALEEAGVDVTYSTRDGMHDFANFRPQLRDAIAWDLFAPVDEHPQAWVNDTVATSGQLWEFGYRFDSAPDRIVRFTRTPGHLHVSGADSPVTISLGHGCEFRFATPGALGLPARCGSDQTRRLRLRVRPNKIRTGKRTVIRIRVRPVVPKTVVRVGGERVRVHRGKARTKVCRRSRGRIRITVKAPGYLKAKARVKVRGRPAPCRR